MASNSIVLPFLFLHNLHESLLWFSVAIYEEAEDLCLQKTWFCGSCGGFFSPENNISNITCNDTHIFQIVLVEGGLEYTEV